MDVTDFTSPFTIDEIPEYDEYFRISSITNDDITNFVYVYDEKKKKMSLEDIQSNFVKIMSETSDPEKVRVFYQSHLDLFINNEKLFTKLLNMPGFNLGGYFRARQLYTTAAFYFETLGKAEIVSPTKSRRGSKFSMLSKATSSSDSESDSETPISFGLKRYPMGSIFNKVRPETFADIVHKMFVYSYFLMESRGYQYIASHGEQKLSTRFAVVFKGIYNNLFRHLEKEVELFCEAKKIKRLITVLKVLAQQFLKHHNIPLAKLVITSLQNVKDCDEKIITKLLDDLRDIKKFERYTYLVDPIAISRAFITSLELGDPIKAFNKIHDKINKTKMEIGEDPEILFDVHPGRDDLEVYNYLNPLQFIDKPLYSEYKDTKDIICIRQSCRKN